MAATASARRFLMCPPTYFDVAYAINPWMRPGTGVDPGRAGRQWDALRATLSGLGHTVVEMPAAQGLPDLVFAANGGIVIGDRAMAPRFRFAQRAEEAEHFAVALAELGYADVRRPIHLNEGEGDFLLAGEVLLAGNGFRSDTAAAAEVADYFDLPVVELTLVDARFYHLDTALAVLDADTVAYFPGAFDARSNAALAERFPEAILAEEGDAAVLGLNMISDGGSVVLCAAADRLAAAVADHGYRVLPVEYDEFAKAGGGPKCCVLRLQDRPEEAGPGRGYGALGNTADPRG
ncbi:MAG: dimethylargininase [bacterium]